MRFFRRIFLPKSHIVRLPSLPRRATILALATIFAAVIGLVLPYHLGDLARRTMARSIDQAVMLSQLSMMYDLQGHRAARESQALMLAGFEITEAGQNPKQVWLVTSPAPQIPAATIDLFDANIIARTQFVWRVLTRPADEVFAMRDPTIAGAENVRAFASFGIWQEYLYDILFRIAVALCALNIVFVLVFRVILGRIVLQSMDDLFMQLYGRGADEDAQTGAQPNVRGPLGAFQDRMREHVDEQARLASLGAGASFLAHDMRNLLTTLHLDAEQLLRMPAKREKRIGERLSAAIEQALSLAEWATLYTSEKRDNINVQRHKLKPLVADALNFVRLHDPRRCIELINECDEDADVVAEETLMFRIIYNLVLNAVQALKGRDGAKWVRVEAKSDAESCAIYVSDNGPGLLDYGSNYGSYHGKGNTLIPNMAGARRPDGTGLGLKIVTDLINWHGGRLDVARADAHGTHFKITLPHQSHDAPRNKQWAAVDAVAADG